MAADVTSAGAGGATAEPAPALPVTTERPPAQAALRAHLRRARRGSRRGDRAASSSSRPARSTRRRSGRPGSRAAAARARRSRSPTTSPQSYHLPNGDQIVDVISKAPSVSPDKTTLPVHYVAVRGTKAVKATRSITSRRRTAVMYSLCGLGVSCSIATGTPSVERGELVRREILELALYTFKYVGGIENVIAFMPAEGRQGPEVRRLPQTATTWQHS